jgi:hypothetical protein
MFSANFTTQADPCRNGLPTPLSPGKKGLKAPPAPYGDGPCLRCALPCGPPRVERFVIECIAPSCHVDIAGHPELVTPAPRDAVDSIMSIEGRGTRAEPRGNVQERKARNERGDAYFEGGLAS